MGMEGALRVKSFQSMTGNLFGSGVAIITFQSIIYDVFYRLIGDGLENGPSPNHDENWTTAYTTVILCSGVTNVLMSAFMLFILNNKNRIMFMIGSILLAATGTLALAATIMAGMELGRLTNPNELHICAVDWQTYEHTCQGWWWMELFVCIFCANATWTSAASVGLLLLACCCGGD